MVKLDIISGFLGAGKTTLVKKILDSLDPSEKIVLIENDFGDVSVDREILEIEGFEIYELANGCVCCTLKGDFIDTLKQIIAQKIDRVIFEPSGIFIIGEIASLFTDPEIYSSCYINSVTTVVDAQNFATHIQSYAGFFKSQICNASTLVLSKTQFIAAEEVSQIELELSLLNETAKILSKDWEYLSDQEILSLVDKKPKFIVKDFEDSAHSSHSLDHDFETMGFRTSKIIEQKQLEDILDKCKNGEYGTVLRCKGFIQSNNGFLEFQYVDGNYSISESEGIFSGIVSFIGTDLQKETLTTIFQ